MSKKGAYTEALFFVIGIGITMWFVTCLIPRPIPPEPADQRLESADEISYEGDRSSKWRSVREEFVRQHPRCEACGSTWDLNVHHIKPFAEHPELELDTGNLITLCREHHFRIGHDPDGPKGFARPSWLLSNPKVREDAASWSK